MASIGVVFQPALPPERMRGVAMAADAAGVDELWLWEDCFRESGMASAAAALAWTEQIRVGVGVLPMPLRNVALTAMETATLERLFPGRFRLGVGHGVLDWMGQVGERVASPLTLMREYVPVLKALLAGERVSVQGRYVNLDGVALDWPPASPVPVLAAGEGPKTLELTGEVADGTILVAGTSTATIRHCLGRIEAGSARRGAARTERHEIVVYLLAGFGAHGAERVEAEMDRAGKTDDQRSAATGSVDEVAAVIERYIASGATTVVLQPTEDEPDPEGFAATVGMDVMPLLARR